MDNINQNAKTIIILGMERSGTSITAKICSALGVDMGMKGSTATPSCPNGNYEDRDFISLNKDICKSAGGSYWNPPALESILSQKNLFNERIKSLLEKNNREKTLWGWKYPWTLLTIDLLLPYLRNPYFIILFRNPLDVAKSTITHTCGSVNLMKGLEIANFYNEVLVRFMKKYPDNQTFIVSFEDLTGDTLKTAGEISDFLDLKLTPEKSEEIRKFMIPKNQIEKKKKVARFKKNIYDSLRMIKNRGILYFFKRLLVYLNKKRSV